MTRERFRARVAVYLVLREKDQILMAKRKNTGYQDGNYSLVSGHLEEGESAKEGLVREIKEEAGIDIRREDLKIAHTLYRPKDSYVCFFFEAKKWEGEIKNMEPEKCSEIMWFSKNNLPKNIAPEIKLALKNIRKELVFGEDDFRKE